jgi:sirohydrochlorin ferrochelatase
MSDEEFCCLVTDNGSYRPEATLSLRQIACALGEVVGHDIEPVSLLHSAKIDSQNLGGRPAQIFEPFVQRKLGEGVRKFVVSPLFFGPSAAITEYLPQRVEAMRESHPELEVTVAPCIVDAAAPDDLTLARILGDLVDKELGESGWHRPAVALVDHGTPRRAVTDVRNLVAEQLGRVLGDRVSLVAPCSMERRDRPEYDYNEPRLENLLGGEGFAENVIVSMLFLSPGRHAGPGGDVAEICANAEMAIAGSATRMTDLVATHPGLIDILARRLGEVLG